MYFKKIRLSITYPNLNKFSPLNFEIFPLNFYVIEEKVWPPMMVVSSVVNNLIRGPAIVSNDRIALRRFADQTTRALATLNTRNCATEINQGNIANMTERLPKPLQNKFATLAYALEAKGQPFPTLADFVDFVNKHANTANHPVNYKPQPASSNIPLKKKRWPANNKTDSPCKICNNGRQRQEQTARTAFQATPEG